MKIRFGLGLDGAVWPAVLAEKRAALGELTVGELGLLQILETHTGLRGPEPHPFHRVLAFHSALAKCLTKKRFYAASFAVDPLGVSRDLLKLRNELKMAGWDGKGIKSIPKLADLAALEAQATLPCEIPDRLLALAAALEKRKSFPVTELELVDPPTILPMLWQGVLERLKQCGVRVVVPEPGALPTPELKPNSPFRLLQCRDPWAAAQWISTYLAQLSKEDLEATVIIAPHRNAEILANACRARGIPFGAATGEASVCRPAVQIVLAMLVLAFAPQNPTAVKALLLQKESHVWSKLRRRLLDALDQVPALGSEDWNDAIESFMEELSEDPESKITPDDVKERLGWAFGAATADRKQGIALRDLVAAFSPLVKWLQGYGQMRERPSYVEAASLARDFLSSLKLLAKDEAQRFPEDELMKLFREVAAGGVVAKVEPARAGGPVIVAGPEKVLGSAQHVVWWDFTVGAARLSIQRFWTGSESAALEKAGLRIQTTSEENGFRQGQWLRPIRFAHKSTVAVSFGLDSKGESEFVHPLLDYLLPQREEQRRDVLNRITVDPAQENAATAAFRTACKVVTESTTVTPWPFAQKVSADWVFPKNSIADRESNSPSSLEVLLGCPVRYALEKGVRLSGHRSADLIDGSLLGGKLAHALFHRVFKKGPSPSMNDIDGLLESNWSALLPICGQALLLDENKLVQQRFAQSIFAAGREYCRFLNENDLAVIAAEEPIDGTLGNGTAISGRPDQLLGRKGKPCLVVDFKFGGKSGRRTDLADGAALQLYLYATIGSLRKTPLDIAYFIIEDSQMLILGAEYKAALTVDGPSVSEVMARLEGEIQAAHSGLKSGAIQAPGVSDALIKAASWEPPCKYCEYDGICGRRWAGVKKATWKNGS